MGKLSKSALGLYEKAMCSALSFEEKLVLTKSSGYDFMELCIDATPERLNRLEDKTCSWELRKSIANTGVPVHTFSLSALRKYPIGCEDDFTRKRGVDIMKKGIEFASIAGIKVMHFAAYDETAKVGNRVTKQLFEESLEECVYHAARFGVIIAFETMDDYFIGSVKTALKYVRMFDSPYLQVYADVANITANGINPAIDMASGVSHIVGIHLKESKEKTVRDIPFGAGDVDFDFCFKSLAQQNYSGVFVAEMWSHDNPKFHNYLKDANVFLREKLSNY